MNTETLLFAALLGLLPLCFGLAYFVTFKTRNLNNAKRLLHTLRQERSAQDAHLIRFNKVLGHPTHGIGAHLQALRETGVTVSSMGHVSPEMARDMLARLVSLDDFLAEILQAHVKTYPGPEQTRRVRLSGIDAYRNIS